MSSNSRLALLLVLLVGGCSSSTPPPPPAHAPPRSPTVFDDLVDKKRQLPDAVAAAQRQHMEAAQRAIDAADAPPPAESPR